VKAKLGLTTEIAFDGKAARSPSTTRAWNSSTIWSRSWA